jgi:nucleoside-diphosphate-sugar epimerase
VLITGSAGFLGRHFVRWFETHRPDDKLVCVDVKAGGMDCRDFFRYTPRDEPSWDLVLHLAAVVRGREQIHGAPLAIAENLAIDSDLFRFVVRTRPARVVYFSSSAAYPVWLQNPHWQHRLVEHDINLDEIDTPDMTYGWAKLTGEYLARFAAAEGAKVTVLRPFSGFGEDQDECYPFAAFAARARSRPAVFDVWGDGSQVRDWIHVDDVVAATMKAVEEDVEGPVNLGWGRPTSFKELAWMMTGGAPLRYLTDKPTGPSYRVSDNRKMLSFYQPKVTLEEGVRRALST